VVRPARSKAAAAASSSLTDPLLATGEGSSTIARQVELHTEQQQQQHQASMLNLMIDASIVSLAGMVAGIVGIGEWSGGHCWLSRAAAGVCWWWCMLKMFDAWQ
jgi:hypothetical protein